ncbi:unnamed protein product [Cylindrotheca closterium]|uniref:DNA-(apurinic or apyrimidinic site) lyase n=1 Tax=Cylindrotheca closterium TaxID=2856 RepID=A0AAD2FQD7_9STRA|nr:unnamed protein product [Cylindrotheca closterium]
MPVLFSWTKSKRRPFFWTACKTTATAALFLTSQSQHSVSAFGVVRQQVRMVEGHSVHRVATLHRQRLVGKKFTAWSPNGRFTDGANAINGKTFSRIEAHGKNLFCFFGDDINQKRISDIARKAACATDEEQDDDDSVVVVHVHFGMAGAWAVYLAGETPPEPTPTNRLRLEYDGTVADLSAMTVQHGGLELYRTKLAKLGEDPLRKDANPATLWARIQKSKKGIGALIMDQSFFTGPGNIYRAEILFKAGVHPNRPGLSLEREEFNRVWEQTVLLLERGYETGSILTVDPEEAKALGKPRLRRYIYNTAKCPRCGTSIQSWPINNRTCYACPRCQPLTPRTSTETPPPTSKPVTTDHVPFNSHCARESTAFRLKETGPSRLTVKEIKQELTRLGVSIPSDAKKKAQLAELLLKHLPESEDAETSSKTSPEVDPSSQDLTFISSEDAALEKAQAGENLAVEHIAELGPSQARRARYQGPSRTRLTTTCSANMKVKEIKDELTRLGVQIPPKAKKAELMDLLHETVKKEDKTILEAVSPKASTPKRERRATTTASSGPAPAFVSPEDAALEKARAGENLAVEHIAELGPGQARMARSRVLFPKGGDEVASTRTTRTKRPAPSAPTAKKSRRRTN